MLTLIRWLINRYLKKKRYRTPEQEVADLINGLRAAASAEELAGALAAAAHARKTLDTTRMVETPFPMDILDGQVDLDDANRDRLILYIRELRKFKIYCLGQGTIMTTAVARGLDIWIVTMLTMLLPNMEVGREIWALLARGEPHVEGAFRFMTRREPSDVERDHMAYRPKAMFS